MIMEIEVEDDKNDPAGRLIAMAEIIAKTEGDATVHARLAETVARVRRKERESHPLWPYRYWIAAISAELPKQGRVTALIKILKESGIQLDAERSSSRAIGRWLKRTMPEIEAEMTKIQSKEKSDE